MLFLRYVNAYNQLLGRLDLLLIRHEVASLPEGVPCISPGQFLPQKSKLKTYTELLLGLELYFNKELLI